MAVQTDASLERKTTNVLQRVLISPRLMAEEKERPAAGIDLGSIGPALGVDGRARACCAEADRRRADGGSA